ncbi:MAG: peptidylprolyl isomerase [Bacteroidetes bacterium]|nr:peptidylprolyl isomerase [Bacteroidota bacterium]
MATSNTAPYSGEILANYTSTPDRRLVIETDFGALKIQLFDKLAPNHVAQIVKLATDGMYDNCTFHRVIPGFMIQGGDPNSKSDNLRTHGTGSMGDKLKQEFNDVSHKRGVCSMARTSDPNSASSQFFICHDAAQFLDRQYTVWGQLTDGFDALDKIAGLKRDGNDNPGRVAVMKKVYVEG